MKIISPRLRRIRRIDTAKVHNFLIQNISAIFFFNKLYSCKNCKGKSGNHQQGQGGIKGFARALPYHIHVNQEQRQGNEIQKIPQGSVGYQGKKRHANPTQRNQH